MSTKIERKNILAELLEAADESGSFEAIIATFGVADSDGDVIEKGAFGDATVAVLPAHDSGSVPLGKAKIEERDDHAVAVGQFNMNVAAAREWHAAIKFDLTNPPAIQEWSWGFFPAEWRVGEHNGEQVRFLSKVDTMEVSPVLRGASVGTRTLSAKRRREEEAEEESESQADAEDHAGDQGEESEEAEESEGPKAKLADEVKAALDAASSAVQRVSEVSESRAKRGKHLDTEVIKELVLLGSEIASLVELSQNITDMKPAEEAEDLNKKARALAAYMAHRARWGR